MSIQDRWLRVPLSSITVRRDARQRRAVRSANGTFLDSDGLLDSIKSRGVLNAVIVEEREGTIYLVAGERRLEACKELGLPDIPVRFTIDLSPVELSIIELEENLKRLDLPWRDECIAVAQLHRSYCELAESRGERWGLEKTKAALSGYSQLSEACRISRDINSPKIIGATNIKSAYNILTRIDERLADDAVNDIIDAGAEIFGDITTGDRSNVEQSGAANTQSNPTYNRTSTGEHKTSSEEHNERIRNPIPSAPKPESIICTDFASWLSTYNGPSFNFIHCDFPYGVGVFAGTQGNTQGGQGTYRDTADTYYGLIETLCGALPRILSHSAHLMFWLTADIPTQHRTLELFRKLAPQLNFNPKPLIWHKTDNVGILADSKRGPRHVYETALFASVEDRLIIRAVSDTYGAPTDKTYHPSTKPEPVLRHFFSMFIDEFSRVLDPTCGSGSALRAAESLGAGTVLGLEKDEEHYKAAVSALRSFRTLRKVAR